MRYGFSSGAAFADGHTLLTASGKDLFQQLLEIGVLYCEVKCSVSAIGAIVVWLFVALELEQLEADAIGSRQSAVGSHARSAGGPSPKPAHRTYRASQNNGEIATL